MSVIVHFAVQICTFSQLLLRIISDLNASPAVIRDAGRPAEDVVGNRLHRPTFYPLAHLDNCILFTAS